MSGNGLTPAQQDQVDTVSQRHADAKAKADGLKVGKNSKFNWKGWLASGASAIALAVGFTQAVDVAPAVSNKIANAYDRYVKGGTPSGDGSVTDAQRATMKKDPRTKEEKLKGISVHESAACKKDFTACAAYSPQTAIALPDKPTRTPEQLAAQQRLDRHAESTVASMRNPGPQGDLQTTLGVAMIFTAAAFGVSAIMKKKTGLTLPQWFHGPGSRNEIAYNLRNAAYHHSEIDKVKDSVRHADPQTGVKLSPAAAKTEIADLRRQEAELELPDKWFGRARTRGHGSDRVQEVRLPDTTPDSPGLYRRETGNELAPRIDYVTARPGHTRAEEAAAEAARLAAKKKLPGPGTP